MLLAALRDLQWRRRRFVIAIIGAGLVFAVSLVGTGLAQAFRNELDRTLSLSRADRWLVPEGVTGPFTDRRPFPAELARQVTGLPGVKSASPVVFARTVAKGSETVDVNLFGVEPGGVGSPAVRDGRTLAGPGEAVVDRSAGYRVGDTIVLAGRELPVVGTTKGATMFGGSPNVYVALEDAQAALFAGQPLATSVAVTGLPDEAGVPAGVKAMTNAETMRDALRVLDSAVSTIDLVRVLLWVVAVTIMGSILYLSAIERTRDIAVFKATGTSTGAVAFGFAAQAALLALGASILAVAFAIILAPRFPMPAEIPSSAYHAMPFVVLAVALLASLLAMRRAVTVEPALAFGG